MSVTNKQPGQCTNCRADILVGGLCLRCTEALQRQNEAMREVLRDAQMHIEADNIDWARLQPGPDHDPDYKPEFPEIVHRCAKILSAPTAGSDLVTREEHEKVKSEAKKWKHEAEGFNVQFMALMSERDQLRSAVDQLRAQLTAATQRAENAEKACTEKDEALRYVKTVFAAQLGVESRQVDRALSSDCGKGYVSKEELKPTIGLLERNTFMLGRVTHWHKLDCVCWECETKKSNETELARLQKLTEAQ